MWTHSIGEYRLALSAADIASLKQGKEADVQSKRLTKRMIRMGCDSCVSHHSGKNSACNASQLNPTPVDPTLLFDVVTKQIIGRAVVVQQPSQKRRTSLLTTMPDAFERTDHEWHPTGHDIQNTDLAMLEWGEDDDGNILVVLEDELEPLLRACHRYNRHTSHVIDQIRYYDEDSEPTLYYLYRQ